MARSDYFFMDTTPHDYGLDWVDNDALYGAVLTSFSNLLGLTDSARDLPPDPFVIIAQGMVTDTAFEENMRFEQVRKVNKSMSNAMGNMHQKVLSLGENWHDLGTAGGVLDIATVPGYVHPRFGKPVVAEVKNRFNTIKASNEKDMWDLIDQASRLNSAQGYLFQITPPSPERYDMMWEPSGRRAKANVRVCDGATAYEIVFGVPDALKQLYMALPGIFADIRRRNGMGMTSPLPTRQQMQGLYSQVYPD